MLNEHKRAAQLCEYYLFDFDFRFLVRKFKEIPGFVLELNESTFNNLRLYIGDWVSFKGGLFYAEFISDKDHENTFFSLGYRLSLKGLISDLEKIPLPKDKSHLNLLSCFQGTILQKDPKYNEYSYVSGLKGEKYPDRCNYPDYILNYAGYERFLLEKKE